MPEPAIEHADRLLQDFAARTGIKVAGDAARRYLWTDAFAVQAWLDLHEATGDAKHLRRAQELVGLVHGSLARHRADDARKGWISGLPEAEGARRPTAGGLRIGKPLPERRADEPLDERLEWERDGQYFHYLTQWMRALARLAVAARDARLSDQAVELARAAAAAFIHGAGDEGPWRIAWKMSIDLSRPLVPASGQHDALDGLLAFARVRTAHHALRMMPASLDEPIERMRAICGRAESFGTADPLGLGCLLLVASEWCELAAREGLRADAMLLRVLSDCQRGLDVLASSRWLDGPPERRLAFRELGLSIGLRTVPRMAATVRAHPGRFGSAAEQAALGARIADLRRLEPLAAHLEEAWLAPHAQAVPAWTDHLDINSVSLAASLARGALVRPRAESRFPQAASEVSSPERDPRR